MNRPKMPLMFGLAALLLVGAGAAARRRETPEQVRLVRKTVPAPVSIPSPSPGSVTPPKPAEPPRTIVPAVPAGADEDVRSLQDWLLSLPQPELRALDGAGELNRRLAQIVAELAKRNAGELDRFLTQLNARMGVVPP
jgi:hypothetical protein